MRKRDFENLKKKAMKEGRLFFRITDQNGNSCNGGDRSFKADPCSKNTPGKWTKKISNCSICSTGYHCTSDPVRWAGSRICLVEVDKILEAFDDKIVCSSFRELEIVTPESCIDIRIYVACKKPYLMKENLQGANLRGANLWGADLSRADLSGANLWRANLSGANLQEADLSGADLSGANLRGANLSGADLWGANLSGANLRGANLYGADLRGANLYGADLRGANLSGADLRGANLRGANLWGADLSGADLRGANLVGANLRGANLSGANLSNVSGINKEDCKKRGAIVD